MTSRARGARHTPVPGASGVDLTHDGRAVTALPLTRVGHGTLNDGAPCVLVEHVLDVGGEPMTLAYSPEAAKHFAAELRREAMLAARAIAGRR